MDLHAESAPGTSERILAATIELMTARGYAATSTRAIAQRAGVNEVTLFRQFGTKQGLLRALAAGFSQAENPYAIAPDVDDIRAALHGAADRELQQVATLGSLAVRLAMDAAAIPEVAAVMGSSVGPQSNLRLISELFEGWQRAGRMRDDVSAALLAEGFSALTSGVLLSRSVLGLPGDPGDIHVCVDVWCDAVLRERR